MENSDIAIIRGPRLESPKLPVHGLHLDDPRGVDAGMEERSMRLRMEEH